MSSRRRAAPARPDNGASDAWRWPDIPKNQWGPIGWRWAHLAAIEYAPRPTPQEEHAMWLKLWRFLSSLPCVVCRTHAMTYIARNPPDLSSSFGLQKWMWKFHNATNARLGKSPISFAAYRRMYAAEIAAAAER